MIRRLTEEDHYQCLSLLTPHAAENLFILGDIEAYGYDQPFQKLWGDFSEDGTLRAVLLKYERNYIPFAPAEFDAEGFAKVISSGYSLPDDVWSKASNQSNSATHLTPPSFKSGTVLCKV
ncbi:hypothetical protein [Bacillus sp. N1-1]|uniref:hypothetical protein n=1 Tax=Bacillus sp. N1-1 TaxID=2682541 RepID=UPI003211D2F8